jgi:hypothetical protein
MTVYDEPAARGVGVRRDCGGRDIDPKGGGSVKVYSIALTASAGAVILMLLASGKFETEEGRIEVPKPVAAADDQDAERISAEMPTQYEVQAARFTNCDLNAVLYHALQTAGGAGPICAID